MNRLLENVVFVGILVLAAILATILLVPVGELPADMPQAAPVHGAVEREDTPRVPSPRVFSDECFLSDEQLDVVRFSYAQGEPHDVGWTLAAIAIKESNAGLWVVNLQDPSAGYYHVTTDKVVAALGWDSTLFNHNRAAARLIRDREFSAQLAIQELLFWRQATNTWLDVWASYHRGGRGPNLQQGILYAQDIRGIIAKIQTCGWITE